MKNTEPLGNTEDMEEQLTWLLLGTLIQDSLVMSLDGKVDFRLSDRSQRGLDGQVAGTGEIIIIAQRLELSKPPLLCADSVAYVRLVNGMMEVLYNQAEEWKAWRESYCNSSCFCHTPT